MMIMQSPQNVPSARIKDGNERLPVQTIRWLHWASVLFLFVQDGCNLYICWVPFFRHSNMASTQTDDHCAIFCLNPLLLWLLFHETSLTLPQKQIVRYLLFLRIKLQKKLHKGTQENSWVIVFALLASLQTHMDYGLLYIWSCIALYNHYTSKPFELVSSFQTTKTHNIVCFRSSQY